MHAHARPGWSPLAAAAIAVAASLNSCASWSGAPVADRHANVDPAGAATASTRIASTRMASTRTTSAMTVTGVVRLYGGPLVIRNGKPAMALDGEPAGGQTVTARRGASEVRRTTTDSHGRFVLRLTPGNWALQACGPVVRVTPATTARPVTLRCDVP